MAQPSPSRSEPPTIMRRMPTVEASQGAARAKPNSVADSGISERPASIGVLPEPRRRLGKEVEVEEDGHDVGHEKERQHACERKVPRPKQAKSTSG